MGVEAEASTLQTFELVSSIHIPVGERGFRLRCSDNEMMVARCFIKSGYKPGDGLGRHFQGDPKPIQISGQKYTFGLGYKPSIQEERMAWGRKKGGGNDSEST